MAHALRYLMPALAFAVAAMAQPAPVRFTVFAPRPTSDVACALKLGAGPQKLVFYPTARSPRYEFRGLQPLRFVDATTSAVIAEATVPSEIQDALLLFLRVENPQPDKAGRTLRYQIAVLDDGAFRLGAGGLAVVNLSGLELSGTIGRHAVVLKAGLNPTLPVERSTRIALRAAFKGKTHQSYADSIELGANDRALLLLFPPYYKGSLEVQARLLIDQPPGTAAKTK